MSRRPDMRLIYKTCWEYYPLVQLNNVVITNDVEYKKYWYRQA